MIKPICFYHSADLDGQCSAALVRRYFLNVPISASPELSSPEDVDLRPINYGDRFPWEEVTGRVVWMVDFSLQPFAQMYQLAESAKHLVWVDHHESALKERDELAKTLGELECSGLQRIGFAGCELTAMLTSPMYHRDATLLNLWVRLPRAVKLLGRYDVFDENSMWSNLDWRGEILPFQYGMRAEDTRPDNYNLWEVLLGGEDLQYLASVVDRGRAILRYQEKQDAALMQSMAFETKLDGHRALAVNRIPGSSGMFASLWDPQQYDIMLTFGWKRGMWTVGVYSDRADIDCSEICAARGGGGHKGAAGFQCAELPFKLGGEKEPT